MLAAAAPPDPDPATGFEILRCNEPVREPVTVTEAVLLDPLDPLRIRPEPDPDPDPPPGGVYGVENGVVLSEEEDTVDTLPLTPPPPPAVGPPAVVAATGTT